MAASSRARSNATGLRMTNCLQSSIPPSGRSRSSPAASSTPTAFATSSSSFSARSASFFTRSTSPTRVNLIGAPPPASSVRFSIHRPSSPSRAMSFASRRDPVVRPPTSAACHRRTCMCSPTTHPGSFRCSLHKGLRNHPVAAISSPSNQLNARRSAMTNSLVRIGTVEGDLVKRALSALIRPSSHHQRRRGNFQPRPSRLSKMSKADDL